MTPLAVLVGWAFRFVLRLRGGGSSVPGRVALFIEPKFLQKTLGRMAKGIYFVSGSNGKSTTTSMLVAVLRMHGLKVLTNPAGGNIPQGLASALLADVNLFGKLEHDVAVIEVDEAYGKLIARKVAPNGLLITNLQFDQLNRFHSPDEVFEHLNDLANLTKDFVVVNGSDSNTERLAFGQKHRLDSSGVYVSESAVGTSAHGLLSAPSFERENHELPNQASLISTSGLTATISVGSEKATVPIPAAGLHYAVDAALAFGMANKILGPDFDLQKASRAMTGFGPVYGRGEVIDHQGQRLRIIMMKNLPSLQANLDALEASPAKVWISVDEGTPDPSWIYDIDLTNLSHADVVSGTKTYQWATRLAYEGKSFGKLIENEEEALDFFLSLPGKDKTAIINYEQMMWLRKRLGLLDLEGGNG
jgi:UDP-N-acetylmuramyl tripeptide synthase